MNLNPLQFSKFIVKHFNSNRISRQPPNRRFYRCNLHRPVDNCCQRKLADSARLSRCLSRLYGIHPPSIWGFLNFIFRGVRAHLEPTPSYTFAPYTTPADQASQRYIMRNSYRDVAYHCSGKQRNPITGWQLNSLCRRAAF